MSQSISRRSFLKCAGSGAVSLAAALLTGVCAAAQQPCLAGEPALLDGKAAVELLGYAPAVHNYTQEKPRLEHIGFDHYVFGNGPELEEYRACRARGEAPPLKVPEQRMEELPVEHPKRGWGRFAKNLVLTALGILTAVAAALGALLLLAVI